MCGRNDNSPSRLNDITTSFQAKILEMNEYRTSVKKIAERAHICDLERKDPTLQSM